jgi:hypothetical protein
MNLWWQPDNLPLVLLAVLPAAVGWLVLRATRAATPGHRGDQPPGAGDGPAPGGAP